jgi:hypothetical protein
VSSLWPQRIGVFGVAWLWRNSVKSSCALARGTPSHDTRELVEFNRSVINHAFQLTDCVRQCRLNGRDICKVRAEVVFE